LQYNLSKKKLLLFNKVVPSITGEFAAAYENFEKDINIALVEATDQLSAGQAETEAWLCF